jgi:hypothetical protein
VSAANGREKLLLLTHHGSRITHYGLRIDLKIDNYTPNRYHFYTMKFEYDSRKSAANQSKHGIAFAEAEALWDDPDLLEIPARTTDETRCLVIGKISGKHWSCVITYRGDTIRIISVRRSRPEEVAWYENESF